ncbi:uncharacterized protein BKCO1_6800044 [Diplodia corticola]|uniref:Uncharacterized protein n=1 Tax=Diplodia corticola TaxID=236234 RepID=A0A1J9RND7_9PEZI|nr:uncharacterized protein BKCO1_6800044 [Diplodia corticola]OJD30007.1 hypothetical protein BKCO1_6800044 [Diplodia corticola]
MSHFPPHGWSGAYGGYQPPPDYFPDPTLGGVPPGFLHGPPPALFPGGPPDPPGGAPPFFPGHAPTHPGFGMPPPHAGHHPPPGFFPPHVAHGGPPPRMPPAWMDPGFGGGSGRGGWQWGAEQEGGGGGGGGTGGGGDDNGGDDGDDNAATPKVIGGHHHRRTGARAGVGMIYNPKQTRLHIFRKTDIGPWKDGARRGVVVPAQKMGGFNIWDADVGWTVKQLLEYLGKGEDAWAVSEVTEGGNGRWYKGSTIQYKDERAGETLSKQGWTEKRGRGFGRPPVWLVLHKVE